MSSKMLIDASHPEETRVVVLKGHRVEEFDFEAANKRQLRGNIYLAKVTRVEPSLQAAFIDYGGNRHGFLAFSEIHPDYYQIPHADRQALLEEEARAHRDEDDETRGSAARRSRRNRREGGERASDRRGPADERVSEVAAPDPGEAPADPWIEGNDRSEGGPEGDPAAEAHHPQAEPLSGTGFDDRPEAHGASSRSEAEPTLDTDPEVAGPHEPEAHGETLRAGEDAEADAPATAHDEDETSTGSDDHERDDGGERTGSRDVVSTHDAAEDHGHHGPSEPDDHGQDESEDEFVEQIGGDALEDAVQRAPRPRRHHYKIQEVIKRRQILLVQVVKEERGNKGAALTTYLSLAGRYSVLMPNTARGGGISRKITDAEDRKRLKSIAQDLEVPEGMGIILRTAGAARSKIEVNRDFEYLLRMWESVRELTLKSTAPTLVYEEGSLIKRSIRDLYTREVDEIVVSGEEGFREAREFMRMLIPSAVKSVQFYRDPQPIFARAGAEAQLDAMFSNHVTLKSGGYLVINQTEALVAIDVNSGRSTREHNIEDTALRTNLEAADEVARQLRLRDLAGLIVVDFIDMEEGRNNRAVERRIKEALKNDRARIQIGRISHFGLLEMSRQRIRTGVLEGSTVICPHCAGGGTIRSTASIALHVLRLLEDVLIKDASHNLIVRTRTEVALYILNQKRAKVSDLEARFGVSLMITVDTTLNGMIYHAIERGEPATPLLAPPPRGDLVRVDSIAPLFEDTEEEVDVEDEVAEDTDGDVVAADRDQGRSEPGGEGGRRRKRRRRRRGRDRESSSEGAADSPQPSDDGLEASALIAGDVPFADPADEPFAYQSDETLDRDEGEALSAPIGPADADEVSAALASVPEADAEPAVVEPEAVEPPRRRRSRRSAKALQDAVPDTTSGEVEDAAPAEEPVAVPKRRRSRAKTTTAAGERPSLAAGRSAADTEAGAEAASDAATVLPLVEAATADATAADLPAEDAGANSTPPTSAEQAPASLSVVQPSAPDPSPSNAEPEPPDSDLPKRSGWWQRAKATFGS